MDDSTILETQDLRKAFGGLVAVAGVSMKVQAHTPVSYTHLYERTCNQSVTTQWYKSGTVGN